MDNHDAEELGAILKKLRGCGFFALAALFLILSSCTVGVYFITR